MKALVIATPRLMTEDLVEIIGVSIVNGDEPEIDSIIRLAQNLNYGVHIVRPDRLVDILESLRDDLDEENNR